MGLMRGLRLTLHKAANIRVNAICPWYVDTAMTARLAEKWQKYSLPVNRPAGVAEIIAAVAASKGMNGKAIYVEGDRGWGVEEGIDKYAPQWFGAQQNKDFHKGNQIMEMVIHKN
jgi:NAD(P)-dependent dehydrogenase (short-subunit alcohol dehydrogenase family)